MRPVLNRRGLWVALVVALGALTGMPSAVAATANRAVRIEAPRATGVLLIDGVPRDGDTVRAAGLSWRPGHLRAGQRLLSFEVAYRWRVCATRRGPCVPAADETVTPFAAHRYVVGHDDVGTHLRLTETATEAVETDPATFTFRVVRTSRSVTSPETVRNDARGQAPTIGFVNGTPDEAHRFQGGELPGHRPAFQRGGWHAGRALPGGPPELVGAANGPRLFDRKAGPGTASGQRAGSQRRGCDDHDVPVAGGSAAGAAGVHCPALPGVLVSAAPRPQRSSDAVGLADRPRHPAPTHGRPRGGHLRHRRLPDHRRRGPPPAHDLAGEHLGPSQGGLLSRPGMGDLPAGREPNHSRRGVSRGHPRQDLLRLSG